MKNQNRILEKLSVYLLLASALLSGVWLEDLIYSLNTYFPTLPFFYPFASCLLLVLVFEALIKRNQSWSLPSLIIYATTLQWYFTEPIYTPENLIKFSTVIIENAYLQIIIFLSCFRFLVAKISEKLVAQNPGRPKVSIKTLFEPSQLLLYLSIIWIGLLLFGISRANGDIFAALFPISSRAGGQMWSRAAGADAGSSGFIVSSASYIYILVCSFFGILLPLQRKPRAKLMNIVLILISWPYFLMMGARNQFLAVSCPSYFSYLLLSKQKWWIKILITGVSFMALDYLLTLIIAYRDVGFGAVFNDFNQGVASKPKEKHLGLNMLEELCFINDFYQQGTLKLSYGGGYVTEFVNFVPRAIWPGKPLISVDYAILRGFGSSSQDIGVSATILTGFIGQGVTNFGPLFGPVAPAFLLSLWAGFLARLWSQRYSILRVCLLMAAVGTTFNLGRDITLLVLWPVVFGYILVRLLEHLNKKKVQQRRINP